jgi:hypothetical protein
MQNCYVKAGLLLTTWIGNGPIIYHTEIVFSKYYVKEMFLWKN